MNDTVQDIYELGKKHLRQELNSVPTLLEYIESCNFTCDQLHEIYLAVEEMRWIDYDDWLRYDDSDRSDELREYREWQS